MPIRLVNIEMVNGTAVAIFDNGARILCYPGPGGLMYPRQNDITDPAMPIDDVAGEPLDPTPDDPADPGTANEYKWPFSLASMNPPRDWFRSSERPSHTGIDWSNDQAFNGAWIRAIGNGTVMQAKFSDYGGGYEVVINHGKFPDGHTYSSWYSHAQEGSFQVALNDVVVQGQNLSRVGTTGNSTGPHLHFGIRRLSSPVDWIDPHVFMATYNPDDLTL